MQFNLRKWISSFSNRFKNIFFLSGVIILVAFITESLHFSESDTHDDTPFNHEFRAYPVPLPDSISFAGEDVPMNHLGVKEGLEQEMLVNTYWQSQTMLIMKRAHRYFPLIESILKQDSIPDDFKYLALAESGLGYKVSNAGAAGFWQLMKSTAKAYGLTINKDVDERYNLVKSTEAACRYFNDAYSELHNWTLVAASYNMGLAGIEREIQNEKENNYYNLSLNLETSRYIYRILAFKQLLTHPEEYGYFLKKSDLYNYIPTYTVEVDSSISSLADFAQQKGLSYHTLKFFNPWLINSKLQNPENKTYVITLPQPNISFKELGENIVFNDSTATASVAAKQSNTAKDSLQPKIIVHIVMPGETVESIAKQYHVPVERLRAWNNISDSIVVKYRDELMIFVK